MKFWLSLVCLKLWPPVDFRTRLSIHKISLNVLFVTQVQVIIHRLLIRHPLRFCQRRHDFRSGAASTTLGDAHGRTERCSSCATRQGRHSKKCCKRYWNWIRDQKKGEVPALPDKPEEQPPIVEPNNPAVAVPSRPLPLPAGMIPTRRSPSCESGMNALPGTLPNVASDKLSLYQVKLPSHRLVIWRTFRYRKVG